MSNAIQIYRSYRQIADGSTARVEGVPLGDCERAVDVFALAMASTVSVKDLTTRTRTFDLQIWRQHATFAETLKHALLGPQVAAEVADFGIWFNDGTDVHKFTARDAAWKMVGTERATGGGTWLSYQIVCPCFVYALNNDPTEISYDDALDTLGIYLQPGGVFTYAGPDGHSHYLTP